MAIIVDQNLCPQNHSCPLIHICSAEAITQEGHSLPKIDAEKCIECGECIKFCRKQAVREE